MICPRCKSTVIVVETEGVEVDWCPDCSGVWFDAGELEVLLGHDRPIREIMPGGPAGEKEPGLRCPRCPERLTKVGLGSAVLDLCPHEHGIWFDAGELESLEPVCRTDESRAMLTLLRTTFERKEPKGA